MEPHVCIIGTGYVGMASAVGLAELGWKVVGYDIIPERVAGLRSGVTPYRESGIEEALRRHLESGQLDFTFDHDEAVRNASLIVISVGTPAAANGSADLRALRACAAALRRAPLREGAVVAIRSTVPPGTSDEIAALLRGHAEVIYAPEFLREGSAVRDFLNPDRTVVGASSIPAAVAYVRLFEALQAPVVITTRCNAELIKVASNSFLAMKITFANEIANLCDALGADADDVLRGVGRDRRIGGAFLAPGIGFGGPCFEKDLKNLQHVAAVRGIPAQLVTSTLRANEHQPRRVVELLEAELGTIAGARIGVWGLAFKAGTDDVRDSLALRIVDELSKRGATVAVYDPAVGAAPLPERCAFAKTALGAIDGGDALLVLTEWECFRDIAPDAIARALRGSVVIDGRNVLDADRVAANGLRYRGIGRFADAQTLELVEAV